MSKPHERLYLSQLAQLEELYEAAKQDAQEAEAYAAELEAKLEKAALSLKRLSTSECFGSGDALGLSLSDSPLGREVVARIDYANTTLAELKGETGWATGDINSCTTRMKSLSASKGRGTTQSTSYTS